MQSQMLKTNLDTNLLKLIAIISMVVDHVGHVFFPQYPVFRWVGRIAFPIFCYCMTVGMLYTHDIKKYLKRLAIFAVISQPFYILAFQPHAFVENILLLNIFFTLLLSLWAVWGFKEKKWWIFILGIILLTMFNCDYSLTGIILMLIFYLCRNRPVLGAFIYALTYIPALFNGYMEDPLALVIGQNAIGFEIFSLLAIPLIYLKTSSNIKISKWFFYAFYPLHLFVIFVVRTMLHI